MHFPESDNTLKSKSKGGAGLPWPGYTVGPGPGSVRPWALEVYAMWSNLEQYCCKFKARCTELYSSRTHAICQGPRGLKELSAPACHVIYTKFTKCIYNLYLLRYNGTTKDRHSNALPMRLRNVYKIAAQVWNLSFRICYHQAGFPRLLHKREVRSMSHK